MKNVAASRRALLENIARSQERNLDLLYLLYMEERLLYRISQSPLANRIVLKGGLLLYSIFGHTSRPTRDIDLLGLDLPAQPEELAALFRPVCSLDFPDGVIFDPDTIRAEVIREGANYQGIRVSVVASLGKVRNKIQLDIGFHDVVTPDPLTIDYPVLLDDPAPTLPVYSLESVIAKKFEAMVSLGLINSRMKDFYDIYLLATSHDFSGLIIVQAVSQTFRRRRTELPDQLSVLMAEFAQDSQRQRMWRGFLQGVAGNPVGFDSVMEVLQTFLGPVYNTVRSQTTFFSDWDHHTLSWH
jgi:predicted nucleotidyltransferase component of viral defense system